MSVADSNENPVPSASSSAVVINDGEGSHSSATAEVPMVMSVQVGDEAMQVVLSDTQAARELAVRLQDGPVTVSLRAYGGFEKVGPLPWELPTSDAQTTAVPGDIMLYQGNQITIFTGSNMQAYTPLGHIDGATPERLLAVFDEGDVDVTLSL